MSTEDIRGQTHSTQDTAVREKSKVNGGSSRRHVRISVSSEVIANRRGEVSCGNVGGTYYKESKPSPAPPHCHHRLRTRPTGGQMVNNCFQHNTDTN